MSTGMLGTLPLSDVRGPRDTLETLLAGWDGRYYLDALNKMLRGENPWPIVARIHEGPYVIRARSHKPMFLGERDYPYLRARASFLDGAITQEARSILESSHFALEEEEAQVEIVLLDFKCDANMDRPLRKSHIFAEMLRLGLERPSYNDVLAFKDSRPDIHGRDGRTITFMHKEVQIYPDKCIEGVTAGLTPCVLEWREEGLYRCLLDAQGADNLSISRLYAARRRIA
jgi:hypothetical protein